MKRNIVFLINEPVFSGEFISFAWTAAVSLGDPGFSGEGSPSSSVRSISALQEGSAVLLRSHSTPL